jgi:hypothetical protein
LPPGVFPIQCDCETISDNPVYLLSRKGNIRLEGGRLRSAEYSRSGSYSVLLDEKNRFAFLRRFRNPRPGEIFTVKIWKFGGTDQVHIVISAGDFYLSSSESTGIEEKGWELMELKAILPADMGKRPIGIYLWNSGNEKVWLDDLEINRTTKD